MARITEAALDGPELARLKADRSKQRSPRVWRVPVHLGNLGQPLSLVLLVGGAFAILAPSPLPFPGDLFGLAAVAVGGWLAGRGPGDTRDSLVEGIVGATLIERRDVIRAAVAIAALRGNDGASERAQRAVDGAPGGQPEPAGGDGEGTGRAVLRAVERAGAADGETLDPAADADAL